MTYIVQRRDRFYVVAYDGIDPFTQKERRRWHPAGTNRADAEQLVSRIDAESNETAPRVGEPIDVETFLVETWLPRKRLAVRPTTAYRYAWIVQHYIIPTVGSIALRDLRSDHLDHLYAQLLTAGGRSRNGLAPKTVHETHVIIRSALDLAVQRHLVDHNVAWAAQPPRPRVLDRSGPQSWIAAQLKQFLESARQQRLYPALHLAAHTGMRRGEIVGLKWSDVNVRAARLSIARTLQNVGGRPTEFGVKTRTSRRCVDLDTYTLSVLTSWRRRLRAEQLPARLEDWMFCNRKGHFLNPESISQLFDRVVRRSSLPRIRFHDLRHTHASLLVAAGVPIKVVSERLGHAHPGFTMNTYQHVLPGMGARAAADFAELLRADDSR